MTKASDSACQCSKAGKRILFVDDERDYCDLILLMSEGYGLNIDAQTSLIDAMQVLHLYDILVTDLDFGHEGRLAGIDLAKSFKVIQTSGVVILITGHQNVPNESETIDFNFVKPIMFDDFIQALLKAVELADSKTCSNNVSNVKEQYNGKESQG